MLFAIRFVLAINTRDTSRKPGKISVYFFGYSYFPPNCHIVAPASPWNMYTFCIVYKPRYGVQFRYIIRAVRLMQNLLIVGARTGIGKALVERVADRFNVWTASRNATADDDLRQLQWDATSGAFPDGFLPDRLDGLVYSPGSITLKPFGRLSDDDFRKDWELNVLGAVRTLQAAMPSLKAAPSASVVLFSTTAVSTGMPMHASIAAAKGAVEGLSRSLAAELAPGIRVNAIAPSLTDTPLAAGLLRTDRQRAAAQDRHPLGRIGKPADIAAAAEFLLSPESAWVTGQVLHVDGGIGGVRRFG